MKNQSILYIKDLMNRHPSLLHIEVDIFNAVEIMKESTINQGKFLICGNGGSAADSDHIVGELMKGFVLDRPIKIEIQQKLKTSFPNEAKYFLNNLQMGIPAISLTSHNALNSAFSNDKAPDLIFAQQVLGYGKKGDVLFAISTSGNSKNVVYAAQIAKIIGMKVISLTGSNGGELRNLSDVLINVPESETYKIQEYHLPIYHIICLVLENEFFGGE
jgi:D-sedoheptulose 7-phosphate isomerase